MSEHRQGCEALGGYGHGVGPCSCGASEQPNALRLADWLAGLVLTYDQVCEDEPGGYLSEDDEKFDAAAAELRRLHAENEHLQACLNAANSEAEADEELMRVAMEAMDKIVKVIGCVLEPDDHQLEAADAALSRLRQRLGE